MSFLNAILEWLKRNLGPGLSVIFESLGKVRWFAVAVVSVVISLLEVSIQWFVYGSEVFERAATSAATSISSLVGGANSASGAVSAAAGLANCVLPVSECFAYGASLLALWVLLFGVKAILSLWRLIPFKAS